MCLYGHHALCTILRALKKQNKTLLHVHISMDLVYVLDTFNT